MQNFWNSESLQFREKHASTVVTSLIPTRKKSLMSE